MAGNTWLPTSPKKTLIQKSGVGHWGGEGGVVVKISIGLQAFFASEHWVCLKAAKLARSTLALSIKQYDFPTINTQDLSI